MATRSSGRRTAPAAGAPPRGAGERARWDAALRQGREQAQLVLEERRRRAARRRRSAPRGSAGLLLAEGDSWFDYPFHDVLEELEQGFGYAIESVAHKGDTVEEMAYDPNQLDRLARRLEKLAREKRPPRAVLLSGGGNDIAGEGFALLLNHKRSGLPPLSDAVVTGLVDERLRVAAISLASAVSELVRASFPGRAAVPILYHGYDYPVPDGRGYLGGFWILPGPWLEPGFRRKGYADLDERCRVMEALIDRWNAVLAGVAGGPGLEHVRHLDLRGVLSNATAGRAYRAWWGDELHPTGKGFAAVAARFDRALRAR